MAGRNCRAYRTILYKMTSFKRTWTWTVRIVIVFAVVICIPELRFCALFQVCQPVLFRPYWWRTLVFCKQKERINLIIFIKLIIPNVFFPSVRIIRKRYLGKVRRWRGSERNTSRLKLIIFLTWKTYLFILSIILHFWLFLGLIIC